MDSALTARQAMLMQLSEQYIIHTFHLLPGMASSYSSYLLPIAAGERLHQGGDEGSVGDSEDLPPRPRPGARILHGRTDTRAARALGGHHNRDGAPRHCRAGTVRTNPCAPYLYSFAVTCTSDTVTFVAC